MPSKRIQPQWTFLALAYSASDAVIRIESMKYSRIAKSALQPCSVYHMAAPHKMRVRERLCRAKTCKEVAGDGKPWVGRGSDEDLFLVGITTKNLLRKAARDPSSFVIHMDAAFKLSQDCVMRSSVRLTSALRGFDSGLKRAYRARCEGGWCLNPHPRRVTSAATFFSLIVTASFATADIAAHAIADYNTSATAATSITSPTSTTSVVSGSVAGTNGLL
ncbi:uncharacterized protein PITG_06414 [Phytophthora infestans T30-4]|uniref:Uncharacterized protein n=1 Tax=Phytophthora infestans (strain T30-4) TaxID=403677 RepID=D0N4T5_PHYIT|nr:uncharacterized protein PITG_06414 [Phytophthora infestans T30-4]EEY69893.1 hypothetical protein PITG_06414 [Phytophthora infestans T30-4]|eukprot:XP_002998540.1 hypothetical protein PITG_06414 [Phytophthora infestans T30-4]